MSSIKKLAGQTAIYGLSSIVGRFLNYLLVPLYTAYFVTEQYGIITEMYSYVAFLVVFLTYGMETTFFRFSVRYAEQKETVYGTIITSLLSSTILFITFAILFSQEIANWLQYPNHDEYVIWFAIIVGLDALSSIPLAKLRQAEAAKKFASINLLNVGVNIGLNLFFIVYCHNTYQAGDTNFLIDTFYNPNIGVGYVFISNLIASIVKFLALLPTLLKAKIGIDTKLLKQMLLYSSPLLIAGLAGIANENIDKIMLKRMLIDDIGEKAALTQTGIYGAVYKISILISLFIQAFRYAAEPFFFSKEKDNDAKEMYATIMNYFVIACGIAFLGVLFYLDIIKHFLQNEHYWIGLDVVPLLLLANIFLGIFFNLSVWYKLNDQTKYGAYLALFGATITIVLNYLWIPTKGFYGSALATLICYMSMTIVSYFLGQKHYKINYNTNKIVTYLGLAVLLYSLSLLIPFPSEIIAYFVKSCALIGYIAFTVYTERKALKNKTL